MPTVNPSPLVFTGYDTTFHFDRDAGVKPPQTFYPLNSIHDLRYPIGFHGLNKDESIGRASGYFPILGFCAGIDEIVDSIQTIYHRVIRNDNLMSQYTRGPANRDYIPYEFVHYFDKNEAEGKDNIRIIRHIFRIELSGLQRLAILALAIAIFIRGLLTFCQVGFIFALPDYLC